MELPEYKSTLPLELLATSLVARLTLDELEWLTLDLARRTEGERREEAQSVRKRLSYWATLVRKRWMI